MSDLTPAQRNALAVLRANPGEWVRASKRRSTSTPFALVNVRAAHALVRAGVAEMKLPDSRFWSPYCCDYTFRAVSDEPKEKP